MQIRLHGIHFFVYITSKLKDLVKFVCHLWLVQVGRHWLLLLYFIFVLGSLFGQSLDMIFIDMDVDWRSVLLLCLVILILVVCIFVTLSNPLTCKVNWILIHVPKGCHSPRCLYSCLRLHDYLSNWICNWSFKPYIIPIELTGLQWFPILTAERASRCLRDRRSMTSYVVGVRSFLR